MMRSSGLMASAPATPIGTSLSPLMLLVEDDALIREVIAFEIGDAGFSVIEAETADEGLRLLSEMTPALLFTDIRMPGNLNGWQLAEEARLLLPNLPVIYATGYTDENPRLVAGGIFVRKPYRPSEIMMHIIRLLGLS